VKLRVNVPLIAVAAALPRLRVIVGCWPAVGLLGESENEVVGTDATVSVNTFVALLRGEAESATCATSVNVPAAAAVPVISPAEVTVRPFALPEKIYGGVPPVAANVVSGVAEEYAKPRSPVGKLVLVMANAGPTVMGKAFSAELSGFAVSVTRAVSVKVPAAVGVPVMAPAAVTVKPFAVPDQVKG
jgi:hypothetical protein